MRKVPYEEGAVWTVGEEKRKERRTEEGRRERHAVVVRVVLAELGRGL